MPANRDHYIQVDKDLMDDPLLLCAAKKLVQRDDLPFEPDQLSDVELLCVARARYVSALLRLWCYADQYIRDDDTIPMGGYEVDSYVGLNGFCEISPTSWLEVIDDDTVRLPGYCEKNNVVSRRKRRKDNADRMKQKRAHARATHTDDTFDARSPHVLRNTNTLSKKEIGAKAPSKKAGPIDDRRRQQALTEAELTPGLNVDAFKRFIAYRSDRKPAVTTASLIALAERLAGFGSHAVQTQAVADAVAAGWQSVNPPKTAQPTARLAWSTRPTQESALAAIEAAARLTDPDPEPDDGYVTVA